MVNTMSALFSGLTILFLFWSITHLARKIIVEDDKTMSLGQMITIMGCGLVGSLAYTFSDTFWFSAVEGKPENVNILNGNAEDLEAECASYEARMKAVGGVDLFLGGIGPDGHIAFNEPGSSLSSRTRIKTLTTDTII